MNPIAPPSGRVHDRQGLKNASVDIQRAESCLRAAEESIEYDMEGRAAFHMLRGAIKAATSGMSTMQSILRNAIHRDNVSAAAEFTEQHSGEDLDQIERDLGIAGIDPDGPRGSSLLFSGSLADLRDKPISVVKVAFLAHLKVVVDFTTENRITEREADEEPHLRPHFQKQDAAVEFLTQYLEAHSDETA